jgi:hypothetical protein
MAKSALVTTGNGALPEMSDELLELAAAAGPQGVSQAPGDQQLSMITLFQSNSPQVDKRSPSYINGAEPGNFRFRGAPIEVRDGVIGFQAIVCDYQHVWNEWGAHRGDGLRGVHFQKPVDAVQKTVDDFDRPQWVRPGSNNVVQECRQLFVLVDGKPFLMPFTGSGHQVVRILQTTLNQFTHPKTGRVLPAFAHKFLVTSRAARNAKGSWFLPQFTRLGFATVAELKAGQELYQVVQRGAYKLEALSTDAA